MRDWDSYLHMVRRQEIEYIFARCPTRIFSVGLELGAGDGYQSSLLLAYVDRLTATDWDTSLLTCCHGERFEVRQCDAEAVGELFQTGQFELVFSSNLLEHLPNVGCALRGVHEVLRDDGITVHVLPNPMWKLCNFLLFYPVLISKRLARIGREGEVPIRRKALPLRLTNNPKMAAKPARVGRKLWPSPHGAYRGHLQELWSFRRRHWLKEFERAGFRVVRVIRGPVFSGYGLGWDRLRHKLEHLGLASEYAYIAVKYGQQSPYEKYFTADIQEVNN